VEGKKDKVEQAEKCSGEQSGTEMKRIRVEENRGRLAVVEDSRLRIAD
jgi:hypothetical protein